MGVRSRSVRTSKSARLRHLLEIYRLCKRRRARCRGDSRAKFDALIRCTLDEIKYEKKAQRRVVIVKPRRQAAMK